MPTVDVGAPGQRLVADADLFLLRQFSQGAQIRDLQLDVGGTVRLNVAAQQHSVAAQLMHKRKFAPGAFHIGGELAAAGAFKITKRLKKRDF